ncbi:MAG: hypothetical protein J0I76_07825 [Thiobacillus sp.]|nr:hypothetical protein [Thiobacillus sp.]
MVAVFTRVGIESGYAGDVDGFLANFPYTRKARGLLALSGMSSGELMEMLDLAASRCPGLADCCAVADVFAGPFEACDGIRFVRTGTDMLNPGWVAYRGNGGDRKDSQGL